MTPRDFILKWRNHALTERAAAQEHFIDLCRLLEHPTPAEADPQGESYSFEKGASKTSRGEGFADVWKRGHFAWEYKKRRRDLDAAMKQLADYAAALDNPPIHVACDTIRFRIETRFTNTVTRKEEFELEDLMDDRRLALLRAVFHDPEALRPKETRAELTREAADRFQTVSDRLQGRYADRREAVAHFVNQLVFCFFADSVKLLPGGIWKKLLIRASEDARSGNTNLADFFARMDRGGEFALERIRWFNGRLFDGRPPLALNQDDFHLLLAMTSVKWDLIDPTIFGTLFERFLDPDKRAQIGAHYTDPEKIMLIVEPVVMRPLAAEWTAARAAIDAALAKNGPAGLRKATAIRDAFLARLRSLSILDPACGSGNFLYLALQAVRDLELKAIRECEPLGLDRVRPEVGPRILKGIEINPFAAELARAVIWIGDIQWEIRNNLTRTADPVLEDLDQIECRDALVTQVPPSPLVQERSLPPLAVGRDRVGAEGAGAPSPPTPASASLGRPSPPQSGGREDATVGMRSRPGTPAGGEGEALFVEAEWPEAEFIVGNPPFLGGKKLRRDLGDETVERLFDVFDGAVPAEADLVCYWFHKAWRQVSAGKAKRAGLVSTNSIRGGRNRDVLEPIAQAGAFIEAWSDEPWVVDGASVRVSLVCFGEKREGDTLRLDGEVTERINADLSRAAADATTAKVLRTNTGLMRQGIKFGGPFEISAKLSRDILLAPLNPNLRPNSDVIDVWTNGEILIDALPLGWCVNFQTKTTLSESQIYQEPFRNIQEAFSFENDRRLAAGLKPLRANELRALKSWWKFQRSRDELIFMISKMNRYIGATEVGKYRIFKFIDGRVLPSGSLYAIARDDDTTFGILHSRFHEAWSLRLGTSLEDRPRYTPTTTFETFPFPEGLTPNIPAADYAADPRAIRIAEAAKRLDNLRNNWLYPADLGSWQPEIVPTAAPGEEPRKYPDRFIPKNVEAQAKLKKRTLTNLYNERPAWLAAAHDTLDRAVAAAYGWPEDIAADEALARLLALNLERAAKQAPA